MKKTSILMLLFLLSCRQIAAQTPIVNLPQFTDEIVLEQRAIFWYGQVTPTINYTDVRIGYNQTELILNLLTIDNKLFFDTSPNKFNLTDADAVSIYVETNDAATTLSPTSYKFDAQLSINVPDKSAYQVAWKGIQGDWETDKFFPFTTDSGWRGMGWNANSANDKGWWATIIVPFSSLGLDGPPPAGTIWKLSTVTHDQDDESGSTIPDTMWPTASSQYNPQTWGKIRFGDLPEYITPNHQNPQTITIRDGVDGITVTDADVGGSTTCGGAIDFFQSWGSLSYPGSQFMNIQNQFDVSDFPCFSKYFAEFPLDQIPPGKVIVSAWLEMTQFGNSGQNDPELAPSSLIQVHSITEDFNDSNLTWNNAPTSQENIAATWVDSLPAGSTDRPKYTWDITKLVADAYTQNQPARLAMYTADKYQSSGKYFWTAEVATQNPANSPNLTIVYGDPVADITPTNTPIPQPLAGDIDNDGDVDVQDFLILISNFGKQNQETDVNNDGSVNIFDFNVVISQFGARLKE